MIVNEDGARLLQVKKDAGNPGHNRSARIHRPRSELQKALNVEMVYVDPIERTVFVTDHNFHSNQKRPAELDGPLPKI